MKTQTAWVKRQLLDNGEITRNQALQNYISRLGAIICDLNQEPGWEVSGEYRKTKNGRDYVYKLIRCPLKKVAYYKEESGQKILVGTDYQKQ